MTIHDDSAAQADLLAFAEARPRNFWSADAHLRATVTFWARGRWSEEWQTRVKAFGAVSATSLDDLVSENDRHPPVLRRWGPYGKRVEGVEHHPAYAAAGELIYRSGVLSTLAVPGRNMLALTLFYLSSLHGEAGHNCPVVCTAGAIKAVRQLGSPECRSKFLGRMLVESYCGVAHAAQFLTELQGGSDVGSNSMRAEPADEKGLWRLSGAKWFCSNAEAPIILATARPAGAPGGTRGLGLFLIPRALDNGELNNLYLRRLKDKLGTRALPTGEIDFDGALAWQLGPVDHGFSNMMKYVISTSRLYNAVGTAAGARRAWEIACRYAKYRRAFGATLATFPMIREALADMRVETEAALSGVFHLVATLDAVENNDGDKDTDGFLRMALNLTKIQSAVVGAEVVRGAIRVLGGNGTIEDFSVLPRLLRDGVVFETWEGTPNTLLLQTLQDIARLQVHVPYFRYLLGLARGHPRLAEALERAKVDLNMLLQSEPAIASLLIQELAMRATSLQWATALHHQGVDSRVLDHYLDLRLGPRGVRDKEYLLRIEWLSSNQDHGELDPDG